MLLKRITVKIDLKLIIKKTLITIILSIVILKRIIGIEICYYNLRIKKDAIFAYIFLNFNLFS